MNKKPNHIPTAEDKRRPFSELLSVAISKGLGLEHPNSKGDWQWTENEFMLELGYSVRNLSNWRNGSKPTNSTYLNIKTLITRSEPYGEEWAHILDVAYKKIEKKKIPEVTYLTAPLKHRKPLEDIIHDIFVKAERVKSSDCIIIGPSYIDVILYPITTSKLPPDREYSNLEEPQLKLGGSSVFVGRSLYKEHGIKAKFISMTSSSDDDVFGSIHHHCLKNEEWISKLSTFSVSSGPPPITFALKNSLNSSKTMFTYSSKKYEFSWENVTPLLEDSKRSRLIYISGFMKTFLKEGFCSEIQRRNQDFIILDHGRFTPGQKEVDCQIQIRRALDLGLIDFHITTLNDYLSLFDCENYFTDVHKEPREAVNELLQTIAAEHASMQRSISIIQDYNYTTKTVFLAAIFDGQMIDLSENVNKSTRYIDGFAFAGNRFNASLIHELLSGELTNRHDDDLSGLLEAFCAAVPMSSNE